MMCFMCLIMFSLKKGIIPQQQLLFEGRGVANPTQQQVVKLGQGGFTPRRSSTDQNQGEGGLPPTAAAAAGARGRGGG